MVYRRFNDFELLAKNLNSLVDKDSLPKLPPKKVRMLLHVRGCLSLETGITMPACVCPSR